MKSYKDYPKINNDRINFSKISGNLPLPYLVEIQTESYKSFLSNGIDEVLKDVFPIENYAKTVEIQYQNFHIETPKYTYEECKKRDLTYSAPLKVTLGLHFKDDNTFKTSEVFMGEIPIMTDSGTFIVNVQKESLLVKLFVLQVLI